MSIWLSTHATQSNLYPQLSHKTSSNWVCLKLQSLVMLGANNWAILILARLSLNSIAG